VCCQSQLTKHALALFFYSRSPLWQTKQRTVGLPLMAVSMVQWIATPPALGSHWAPHVLVIASTVFQVSDVT
jgi:hypothetical protein